MASRKPGDVRRRLRELLEELELEDLDELDEALGGPFDRDELGLDPEEDDECPA